MTPLASMMFRHQSVMAFWRACVECGAGKLAEFVQHVARGTWGFFRVSPAKLVVRGEHVAGLEGYFDAAGGAAAGNPAFISASRTRVIRGMRSRTAVSCTASGVRFLKVREPWVSRKAMQNGLENLACSRVAGSGMPATSTARS